jgi:hypothetical protein
MSVQNDHQVSHSQAENAWTDYGSDFVLIEESKPPPRIELARERLLICRLYLGLLRTIPTTTARSLRLIVTAWLTEPSASTSSCGLSCALPHAQARSHTR